MEAIDTALKTFSSVPGRFELIEEGQDFAVVVDYAHTPDGLQNILETARAIKENRIIIVFGCGGDAMLQNVQLWAVLQQSTVIRFM